VDVTTHLGARTAQAGAFLAVTLGGIAALPAAALADPPNVTINQQNISVLAGGQVSLDYTVKNTNKDGKPATFTVTVDPGGLFCNGCNQSLEIDAGADKPGQAALKAPDLQPGQTQQFSVKVTATNGPDSDTETATVTVKGPDKPATVRSVSGKIKDKAGKGIGGASVAIQDSNGKSYRTLTNSSGNFAFNSSDVTPISPGQISLAVVKDGYISSTTSITADGNRSVNVPITLASLVTAAPSASASPTPSAGSSPPPTDQAVPALDNTSAPQVSINANTNANAKKASDDSGSSMMFILLGGLLVAAGVGVMVLVILRRRNNSGGDDDGGGPGPGPGGPPAPPGGGRYGDATRVGGPVAAVRSNDATMVAPLSGAPSLADAPTMLQRPVPAALDDEFPDPYGAPLPRQGGYVNNNANWDDQPAPAGGYGAANADDQYGGGYQAPTGAAAGYGQEDEAYGAYGAQPAGGYQQRGPQRAPQQRYDEATSLWQPGEDDHAAYPAAGYDQQDAGYGAGGHQAEDAYGSWGAQGGHPDGGNGYGPQAGGQYGAAQHGAAQHGAAQPGGYEDEQPDAYGQQPGGGYGQRGGPQHGAAPHGATQHGGYEQPDAYGQQPGYEQDDYDGQPGAQGGYRQGGGRPGGGRPGAAYDPQDQAGGAYGRPAQRRSSEWD
jgi:hypothetical protein